MRRAVLGVAAWVVLWSTPAGADPAPAPPTPDTASSLAAASLQHSAESLLYAGRPGGHIETRRHALCAMALRLHPAQPYVARMLVGLYEGRSQFDLAHKQAEVCLTRWPRDAALTVRWLQLRLAALQDADQRQKLLAAVRDRADYPKYLRAEAGVALGDLYRGQGHTDRARVQYDTVLQQWDPLHPKALRESVELQKAPTAEEIVVTHLKLLEGNPGAVDVAWRLAVILDELGLARHAVAWFARVLEIARHKQADARLDHSFWIQYCNAMLNAGQAHEAITLFEPLTKRFPRSLDLHALLVEAYLMADDLDKVQAHVEALAKLNQAKEATCGTQIEHAKDLATFYLISRPDLPKALAMARLAARQNPQDLVAQRLLGAAEVKSGQAKLVPIGAERLRRLAGRDAYAAAFLAEHRFARKDKTAATDVLTSALQRGGTGPAMRRLRALAQRHKVAIPAIAGQDLVRRRLDEPRGRLDTVDMALRPEKYLRVVLTGPREGILPGEPVIVQATLTNTSTKTIRLGNWGLLKPQMDFSVMVRGERDAQFAHLRLFRWPAPAELKPKQSVTAPARLDLGPLEAFLTRLPLAELKLTVAALLDPVQSGQTFQSWVPSVPVQPITITRAGLLGSLKGVQPDRAGQRYRKLVLDLTRAIKKGTPADRMLAARRVGALLGLARRVELNLASLPDGVAQAFGKPMLLALMRALLQDKTPAVRAEMIAALATVDLDEPTLRVLSPMVEDSDSLVRLRLVELLGATSKRVHRTIVDYLAQDEDETVRLMASAFKDQPTR